MVNEDLHILQLWQWRKTCRKIYTYVRDIKSKSSNLHLYHGCLR